VPSDPPSTTSAPFRLGRYLPAACHDDGRGANAHGAASERRAPFRSSSRNYPPFRSADTLEAGDRAHRRTEFRNCQGISVTNSKRSRHVVLHCSVAADGHRDRNSPALSATRPRTSDCILRRKTSNDGRLRIASHAAAEGHNSGLAALLIEPRPRIGRCSGCDSQTMIAAGEIAVGVGSGPKTNRRSRIALHSQSDPALVIPDRSGGGGLTGSSHSRRNRHY